MAVISYIKTNKNLIWSFFFSFSFLILSLLCWINVHTDKTFASSHYTALWQLAACCYLWKFRTCHTLLGTCLLWHLTTCFILVCDNWPRDLSLFVTTNYIIYRGLFLTAINVERFVTCGLWQLMVFIVLWHQVTSGLWQLMVFIVMWQIEMSNSDM